jgi:hypothetical protein
VGWAVPMGPGGDQIRHAGLLGPNSLDGFEFALHGLDDSGFTSQQTSRYRPHRGLRLLCRTPAPQCGHRRATHPV